MVLKVKITLDGYIEKTEKNPSKIKVHERNLYKGLQSKDDDERLDTCKMIFKTIFHEVQHHRQYMLTQLNISNKDSMMYAKEMCLKQILDSKFYSQGEDGNYYELLIENNANYVGVRKFKEVMQEENSSLEDEIDFYCAYMKESKYFIDCDSKNGKKHYKFDDLQEKEDIATQILDENITEELLIKYPILQKEYNMDGSKKNIEELVTNLKNEIMIVEQLDVEKKEIIIKDTKNMYFELIYNQIKNNKEIQDKEKLETSYFKNILDEMTMYFNEEKTKSILNCKIICDEKFLYEDQNPKEEYEKMLEEIKKKYNAKLQNINEVKESIIVKER